MLSAPRQRDEPTDAVSACLRGWGLERILRRAPDDGDTASVTPPADRDKINAQPDGAPGSLSGDVEMSVSEPALGVLWPFAPAGLAGKPSFFFTRNEFTQVEQHVLNPFRLNYRARY